MDGPPIVTGTNLSCATIFIFDGHIVAPIGHSANRLPCPVWVVVVLGIIIKVAHDIPYRTKASSGQGNELEHMTAAYTTRLLPHKMAGKVGFEPTYSGFLSLTQLRRPTRRNQNPKAYSRHRSCGTLTSPLLRHGISPWWDSNPHLSWLLTYPPQQAGARIEYSADCTNPQSNQSSMQGDQ